MNSTDLGSGGGPQDPNLGHRVRSTGFEDFVWYENTTFNALFEVETDLATLVSSTSFFQSSHDADISIDGFIPTIPFQYGEFLEHRTFVQELRMVSKGEGPLQWLAGVYYLDRDIDFAGSLWAPAAYLDFLGIDYSAVSNAPRSSHADPNRVDYDPNILIRTNNEAALFGELTYQLTDTLSLTAGLRYTETEYINHTTSEGSVTDILGMMIDQTPGVATSTPDVASTVGTGTQTSATPKLTLSWQPNDAHNIYITAAKGFRRAHPNALPPDIAGAGEQVVPAVADSDELWNYELGLKSRLLDGRVQANVAVYQIDWEDIQISATRVSDSYPFLVAGGDVESTGLEVELFALPTENLELGFSLTLADAKVDSLTQEEAESTGLVLGHKTPAPETQYTLFGQYTWQLNSGALYARADFQHVGDYIAGPPNIPGSPTQEPNRGILTNEAYENLNVQIGWGKKNWRLTLYGENILDNDDYIDVSPGHLGITNTWARFAHAR